MNMVNLTRFAASLAILLLANSALATGPRDAAKKLEALHWYSEEYPPYNFAGKDGVPTGMAVDILMAAFKRIGVKTSAEELQIIPWNRSYKFIQRRPGTALFSMTYTPERLKIMKFVGPSVPSNISIIAPKASEIDAKDAGDLIDLTIGVVRDDIGDQLVRNLALSDGAVKRKNSLRQLLYLLDAGRIDAVAYSTDVFNYSIQSQKLRVADYEEIFVLKHGKLGYAFYKDTPDEVLEPLQNAIDEMRAEGMIDKIIARYRN